MDNLKSAPFIPVVPEVQEVTFADSSILRTKKGAGILGIRESIRSEMSLRLS